MRDSSSVLVALALSAGLAATFGVFARDLAAAGVPTLGIATFKALPIFLLAGLAGARDANRLAMALALGATGDFYLALNTPENFLVGACAFLIGHLFYIALFLRNGDVRTLAQPLRLLGAVAMIAAAIAGTLWLVPSGTPLFAPLSVYTGVLTLMTISTFTLPASRWLVMLGGVLFFVSDGFVAHNMFHAAADPQAAFALSFAGWMIYWAGQAALCAGALTLGAASSPK